MIRNPVIDVLMHRASTRAYTAEVPSQEVIETVVRAGQQAPFAYQMCSVVLERSGQIPWGAPLAFIICADAHRMSLIARRRGWDVRSCDLSLLLFAIQDAAYLAQNMVIAGESLGLGSCFIGSAPMLAPRLIARHKLPPKVFPLVMLVMGYPAEKPSPRPRFPLEFTLFEGAYPRFTEEQLARAMHAMDEGYLAQDYYRKLGARVAVPEGREDRVDERDYSWTEHISRKLQWMEDPAKLRASLRRCGFDLEAPGGT
jgi:FMN reductase (NADPH)